MPDPSLSTLFLCGRVSLLDWRHASPSDPPPIPAYSTGIFTGVLGTGTGFLMQEQQGLSYTELLPCLRNTFCPGVVC